MGILLAFATAHASSSDSQPTQLGRLRSSLNHLPQSTQNETIQFMGIELDSAGNVIGYPTDVVYTSESRGADFEALGQTEGKQALLDLESGLELFTDQSRFAMPACDEYASPLDSRVGYECALLVSQLVAGRVERSVWTLPDGAASKFLTAHPDGIEVSLAYPDTTNPWAMPAVAVFASDAYPLAVESIRSVAGSDSRAGLSVSGPLGVSADPNPWNLPKDRRTLGDSPVWDDRWPRTMSRSNRRSRDCVNRDPVLSRPNHSWGSPCWSVAMRLANVGLDWRTEEVENPNRKEAVGREIFSE
jgi:hypothetical protein